MFRCQFWWNRFYPIWISLEQFHIQQQRGCQSWLSQVFFSASSLSGLCLALAANGDASDVAPSGNTHQQTLELVYDAAAGKVACMANFPAAIAVGRTIN